MPPFFTELCPPKYNQTQVNGCRIESINITAEIKDINFALLLCLFNHVISKGFKDMESLFLLALDKLLLVTFLQDLNGRFSLDELPKQ